MTGEQLEQIVQRLDGQCVVALEQAMEEAGVEETPENLERIDARVFCCEGCDWWCSTDELNNETDKNLCDECAAEDHDE